MKPVDCSQLSNRRKAFADKNRCDWSVRMANSAELDVIDYQALAEFRYQIRKFWRFSEAAVRAVGLEPQHHQLMLALKGMPDGVRATVGELAERMQIRHHSSVELIDRLTEQGLVQRRRSEQDRRQVLVALTARGERILRELSIHHREELQAIVPQLIGALRSIVASGKRRARVQAARTPADGPRPAPGRQNKPLKNASKQQARRNGP
jgi:DNA-binding MarR family transcriptional regulator